MPRESPPAPPLRGRTRGPTRPRRRRRVLARAPALALLAAQEGLSLAAAVRANGLAGGGPERPAGARRALLRRLAHTVGADGVFVRLAAPPAGGRPRARTTRCWSGATPRRARGATSAPTGTGSTATPAGSTGSSWSTTGGR